jgi:clan AA aspartic protease (TIGR02281 family)
MIGEVKGSGDQPVYNEWLYENGQKTMHSYALCRADTPHVTTAPPIITTPPVTTVPPVESSGEDSIPIIVTEGRKAHATVQVGSHLVKMLLDTGATDMLVTRDVADELILNGDAKPMGSGRVTIADGSTVNEQLISINRVKIGSHVFVGVPAGVVENNKTDMLFPLSLLGGIGKFTFDLPHNKLIFN